MFPATERTIVSGIDEAGRGCLAGPVVAAAVILPDQYVLPGLKDSKAVTPAKRETLARTIKQTALAWSIGVIWQKRIDQINILQATFEAMARGAATLKIQPNLLLIDGNRVIPDQIIDRYWRAPDPPRQRAIIKGDQTEPAISAASIIAKTFRDRLMTVFGRHWPQYGFERHKGYGTRDHLAAIAQFGPSPLHRLTFRGVLL